MPRDKDAEVREVTAQLSGLLAELRETVNQLTATLTPPAAAPVAGDDA